MFITKVRTNCLHPYKFFNKYTNTTMIAPCGRCTACSVVSGNKKDLLIQAHASTYKCVAFVTLTFSNSNLPFARLVDVGSRTYLVDNECNDIILSDNDLINDFDKEKLYDKFRCVNGHNYKRGLIPYLDYSVLPLFFASLRQSLLQKRIRIYDNPDKTRFHYERNDNYSEEKINYFLVGEYGTRSFRPHFHILFFFDDPSFYKRLSKTISKIWMYGSVNFKISTGSASSYVASYVASNVCIPFILKSSSIRPKSLHSLRFGYKLFETCQNQIAQDVSCFTNDVYFTSNGKVKSIGFTNSYINSLYPKQVGFTKLPSFVLYRLYTCYEKVVSYYSECSPTKLANYIVFDVSQGNVPSCLTYLGFNDTDIISLSSDDVLKVSYLTRILSISRRFLSLCAFNNYDRFAFFLQIRRVYQRLSYLKLRSLYANLEVSPISVVNAYYSNPEYALLSPESENAVALTFESAFIDSFKHKDVNDFNQILFN
nr:MAG TPA: Replication associated protein [Microviridae sp.]